MNNPFLLGTPHYAAWERLATLQVLPQLTPDQLVDVIEQVVSIFDDHIQPRCDAAYRRGFKDSIEEADKRLSRRSKS